MLALTSPGYPNLLRYRVRGRCAEKPAPVRPDGQPVGGESAEMPLHDPPFALDGLGDVPGGAWVMSVKLGPNQTLGMPKSPCTEHVQSTALREGCTIRTILPDTQV
jgi:hypothetical protein